MSTLGQGHRDTAVLSEINITPFTDVLLVLLIIFMILASLAIPPGFERQFACACGAKPNDARPRIAVTVDRRGGIFVQGAATSVSALYPLLVRMHARMPRATVSLFADARAPYGVVMRVLDAAKAGGVPDVSFVTE